MEHTKLSSENPKEKIPLKDLGIDGMIILNHIL
jgi:hypothetical protein